MIDKGKVVDRLLKNRLRFKNNWRKLDTGELIYKLDPTCLCGLEVGDRFKKGNTRLQIKSSGSEVYLVLSKV